MLDWRAIWAEWRVPAISLALWTLVAAVTLGINRHLATVTMVWGPAGIAVTALFVSPARHWKVILWSIFVAAIAVHLLVGLGMTISLGSATAQAIGPWVAAYIARKAVRDRRLHFLRLRDMVTLTNAAAAGAIASAIVVWPFRSSHRLVDLSWWVLAFMLGIMVLAPLSIFLRQRMREKRVKGRVSAIRRRHIVESGLILICCSVAAYYVLNSPYPLIFLLVVLTICGVIRFGQVGASIIITCIAIAGQITSAGGMSPFPAVSGDRIYGAFMLQMLMAIILAVSLPLAALLMSHKRLSDQIAARNERLHRNIAMLSLAEKMATIGRWRRDHISQITEWSRELRRMSGLDVQQVKDMGQRRNLALDGGISFEAELKSNYANRGPFSFETAIVLPDGSPRRLKMQAQNRFGEDGTLLETFGVVMDVTEQRDREKALSDARADAMRMAAEAQLLAQTDSLTMLANRRRVFAQLENFVCEAARPGGAPLAVVIFDIDHFKLVNDTYGHQAGDTVLIQVAELARSQARANDLVGRIGGEEFVWLIPGADNTIAAQLAERLRAAIADQSGIKGLPPITVSIGFAGWQQGDTPDSIMARADVALYAAKGNGRNQVREAA